MNKKKSFFRIKGSKRGQSFVELMLIVLILALLLSGVVEFGFLMNNYLHVLDAARESARYASSYSPFIIDTNGSITNFYDPHFYYVISLEAANTMEPVLLHSALKDDIVISVFSVGAGPSVRFPLTMPAGWSLCSHFGDFSTYLGDPNGDGDTSDKITMPDALSPPNWTSGCTPQATSFATSAIDTLVNASNGAPPTGVLLVEIYYNYPQLLKLPVFTEVIPDPIPVYVYSVMPISAAEPTATKSGP